MTKAEFNQMVADRGFINLTIYYINQNGSESHTFYSYNPFTVSKSLAVSRALAKLERFAKSQGDNVISFRIHTENELDH